MEGSVAVLERVPAARRGICVGLEAIGFSVEEPRDVVAWSACTVDCVVVVSVQSSNEFALITRLRRQSADLPIVALISDATFEAYQSAMSAGATSAVHRSAEVQDIVDIVSAAARHWVVLPEHIADEMVRRTGNTSIQAELSAEQTAWLQDLADGRTVSALAEGHGYSRRAMHRQLRRVYGLLEAESRSEAIARAVRTGLVR